MIFLDGEAVQEYHQSSYSLLKAKCGCEAMPETLQNVKHMITVASGKGGVGKTTATVHLALALSARGLAVGIFDADIYGPNVPLMLGVRRSTSMAGLVPIARANQQPYIRPLKRFGLEIMSVGLLVGEQDAVLPDPHDAARIVTQTLRDMQWGNLDVLLIDLPPGTGEPQHSLLREYAIERAILVSTPQDLAMLDVGRSLAMFRQAGIATLGLIENMSYVICPNCGEQIEIFTRSQRHLPIQDQQLPILGRVPMLPLLSHAISDKHPLLSGISAGVHEAQAMAIFHEIAAKVAMSF